MAYYGWLSNQGSTALVNPQGAIEWLAFHTFDAPPVLCRLLGGDAQGVWRLTVPGGRVVRRRYLPHSLVLRTDWATPDGPMTVTDYLVPGHPELRRLVRTPVPLTVTLIVSADYGRSVRTAITHPDGAEFDGGIRFSITRQGGLPFPAAAEGIWMLPPGRYVLTLSEGPPCSPSAAHASIAAATRYWRRKAERLAGGRWQSARTASALVLYGCSDAHTGGMVAAPTTSLPETLGGTRQWDYRFVWIRDTAYAAEALLAAGDATGAYRLIAFLVRHLPETEWPAPCLRTDGSPVPAEQILDWLPGYGRSAPCRIGNAAAGQYQADAAGTLIDLVWRWARVTGRRGAVCALWPRLRALGDLVCHTWQRPDASLWEFRDAPARYTHSQMMHWVALTTGAALGAWLGDPRPGWLDTAVQVRAQLEATSGEPNPRRYWQAPDHPVPDAALLCLPLYGYCQVDDPRFQATLAWLEDTLVTPDGVYRYPSDFAGPAHHPFLLAACWLARVYLREGRWGAAEGWIRWVLHQRTALGLLGEHLADGEPRGNFPQAFVAAGLLTTLEEWRTGATVLGEIFPRRRVLVPGYATPTG